MNNVSLILVDRWAPEVWSRGHSRRQPANFSRMDLNMVGAERGRKSLRLKSPIHRTDLRDINHRDARLAQQAGHVCCSVAAWEGDP